MRRRYDHVSQLGPRRYELRLIRSGSGPYAGSHSNQYIELRAEARAELRKNSDVWTRAIIIDRETGAINCLQFGPK